MMAWWGKDRAPKEIRRHLERWGTPSLAKAHRGVRTSIMATIAGAVLGTVLGDDAVAVATPWLHAWIATPSGAREALATMFGVLIALATIALAPLTFAYQSLGSQYSPRILGLISTRSYLEFPLIILSGAYLLAGLRKLGLSAASGAEPRPVVVGALLLLLVAAISVLWTVVRAFLRLQVEELLHSIRQEALAGVARLTSARQSVTVVGSRTSVAEGAKRISSPASGYVIGYDLVLLDRLTRRFGLTVRLERGLGDFVARGEALGWLEAGADPGDRAARSLARGVLIAKRRSPFLDVDIGLRILADIANRALSPAINDPTTARQAVHQMRVILHALAALPPGGVAVVDWSGEARISLPLAEFQDYLSTALDGPSRYGAGDPDVIADILDLLEEVGSKAPWPQLREEARLMAMRTVGDVAARSDVHPDRLAQLRRREQEVIATLDAKD